MKKTLIFLLGIVTILLTTNKISGQNIYTIAGNGTSGFSGDGGQATLASIKFAFGVAVDASGNVYIADTQNHRIRKVTTTGVISTIAGTTQGFSGDGGPAVAAEFNNPTSIAIDGSGNLYITDWNNHRIRKIDVSGTITTIAGNGTIGFSGDGGPATSAQLNYPWGVAADFAGNVFIADFINWRIRKVSTTGTITTIAGNGIASYSGDGGLGTSASINKPRNVAVDGSGNVYIADQENNCIRKVNTSGIISTFAGNTVAGFSGDGGAATSAQLNWPSAVAADPSGNIYITDQNNDRIRKVNTSGIISTIGGNGVQGFSGDGGLATSAQLYYPLAITIDGANNIVFSDTYNQRIRTICQTSCISGLNESQNNSLQINVFPNPNNGSFKLQIDNQIENGEIILISLLGQIVHRQKISQGANSIITSDFAKGLYNYIILRDKGQIGNGKLTID